MSAHQGLFSRALVPFGIGVTNVEQRYVIKCLYAMKVGLHQIVAQLTSTDGEHADAKGSVKYWIHQVRLGRTDMGDEARPEA
jgi:hypothetical protein